MKKKLEQPIVGRFELTTNTEIRRFNLRDKAQDKILYSITPEEMRFIIESAARFLDYWTPKI